MIESRWYVMGEGKTELYSDPSQAVCTAWIGGYLKDGFGGWSHITLELHTSDDRVIVEDEWISDEADEVD